MKHLLPCPSCARHVRAIDPICPFCAAELPMSLRESEPPRVTKRLGRAATLAFGAALAASGCTSPSDPIDAGMAIDAGEDAGQAVALYGGPADAGSSEDAGEDGGTVVALYGAPAPQDAGADAGEDGGMVVAAYGAPADPDA